MIDKHKTKSSVYLSAKRIFLVSIQRGIQTNSTTSSRDNCPLTYEKGRSIPCGVMSKPQLTSRTMWDFEVSTITQIGIFLKKKICTHVNRNRNVRLVKTKKFR